MSDNGKRYAHVMVDTVRGPVGAVLDRVTGDVTRCRDQLPEVAAQRLNEGWSPERYVWICGSGVRVLGELGPVPERIKPPFKTVRVVDPDGDELEVRVGLSEGDRCAHVSAGDESRTTSAYVMPELAPMVASAILRAAGVDPESVDWAEAARDGEQQA